MDGEEDVQMRKKRKVSSVMGWLLRRQLSEPAAGAGVCCAVSMVQREEDGRDSGEVTRAVVGVVGWW